MFSSLLRAFVAGSIATGPAGGPWDVTVTAEPSANEVHADLTILVAVDNPGPSPVLVGLTVRPRLSPLLLAGRTKARVPRRPARPRYRAERQQIVSVVPANASAQFPVHLTGAVSNSFSVVVVAGQCDRRLRVITVPVTFYRPYANYMFDPLIFPPPGWM